VQVLSSFRELAPLWAQVDTAENPTLSAEWLGALESTGCVDAERGWIPHHLAVLEGDRLVAAMPGYLKLNSEGEFIFDHAIARAASRFGVRYFPKLLFAVPFTPATGPRILFARDVDASSPRSTEIVRAVLAKVLDELPVSSLHVLFLRELEATRLASPALLHRASLQFHWKNRGYSTFEDFLGTLPSKRRTAIRRERRALAEQRITLENLRDERLSPAVADVTYELYLTTVDKFLWGRRYLNRAFFEEVLGSMKGSLDLVWAREAGVERPVAAAFNLRSSSTLYGRYWGAFREVPFLHFNVCFYHSIEQCILEGRQTFEPGAGGEHKLARGFEPTVTHSLHAFEDERLHASVADFFERERVALEAEIGSGRTDS
jgi:predicted N-acyltransferase